MDILILNSTAKSIVASLGEVESTASVKYTVSYGDATSSGLIEANQLSVSNNTSYVTVCSAPASSTRRLVRNITVYNADTISHNVSIKILVTATYYTVTKIVLTAGESWSFKKSGSKKSYSPITESSISLSDITTNNASTVNHGFLPKLSGSTAQFLNGNGAFANLDGWVPSSATWTYSSVDSPTGIISANADLTAVLQKGMRVKYNQAQALTGYCSFDASSAWDVGAFTSTDTAMTYTGGKFSNAATFNGTTSKIVVTDTALLKPTGEFTFGMWFKTSNTGAAKNLFQSYSQNTNWAGFGLYITANNVLSYYSGKNTGTVAGTDTSTLTGTTTVTDNSFHYVVFTFRNNIGQLYLDGKLEVSGYCLTPAYSATNYVRIGCGNNTGTDITYMNGQIDDFLLINGYALDEKTIYDKYILATAQGTGNITITKNAIVTDVGAYASSATLVTLYHGTDFTLANATISSPNYSSMKLPFGFNPTPSKWTTRFISYVSSTKTTPTQNVWYNIASESLIVPIGQWILKYNVQISVTSNAATTGADAFVTLATNSGSTGETDKDFSGLTWCAGASGTLVSTAQIMKSKDIPIPVKTTYYIIVKTARTDVASIALVNLNNPLEISCQCSYL